MPERYTGQGRVILAGHSYGGAVITEAGNDPKVAALVYVSAFAPGDGQSINDLLKPFPKPVWQSTIQVGPLFAHALDDKTTRAAWKSKPPWWVVSLQDQIIPAALQKGMASGIGAAITTVDSGHLSLVTHPNEVAAAILAAARKTAGQ